MATCKDCLHFDVCQKSGMTVDFDVDDGVCLHFLEQGNYVEAEKYNELREAFVDCVYSGAASPAPWCKNRSGICTNGWGHCLPESGNCDGFNPDGRTLQGENND